MAATETAAAKPATEEGSAPAAAPAGEKVSACMRACVLTVASCLPCVCVCEARSASMHALSRHTQEAGRPVLCRDGRRSMLTS